MEFTQEEINLAVEAMRHHLAQLEKGITKATALRDDPETSADEVIALNISLGMMGERKAKLTALLGRLDQAGATDYDRVEVSASAGRDW